MAKVGIFLAFVAVVGAAVYTMENGSFTTLFSSTAGRPSIDRSQTRVSSAAAVRQPEVKQPDAIAPTPAAPVSNGAPALDKTASAPSAEAGGRVAAEEVLVPDAKSGASRTALTAEEKDAVARGLKELGITAASATPDSQSQQTVTAELNRKALADSVAAEARSRQLQAQNPQ